MKKYLLFFLPISLLLLMSSCQNDSLSPTEVASDQNMELSKKGGSALDFDGSTGYVEVPDHPSLDITDEFTITAWINLSSYTEWASIVTKGGYFESPDGALQDNNYTIHQSGPNGGGSDGRLRFTCDALSLTPVYPESDTQIPLNEWHHIAVTFDGSLIKFYLDGCPDGQTVLAVPLVPNNNALRIGVDLPGGDEYWDGKIDEVKIWNKSLSASHIFASMHGNATPRASSLVGYWRFNEGSGQIVYDRSKYHNDGTLNGGVVFVSPGVH